MLSTAAFNALLKTLEEPPAHVIFILATTEIQKVPATILSRCQRYDFTRIGPEDIAQRVEYIAGQEGLELTTGGAELISRLADGAMRDALSILDTCAGVTAKSMLMLSAGWRASPTGATCSIFRMLWKRRTAQRRWLSWPHCGSSRWM